ncbi:hypothetical protein BS47DRAFT_417918 [Hydnum rufescens UP504]|uniref:Uncharacterized protein n=1 Tax=Hydnum rufescens UP504 TaxID=1448309 RepID=A0A9P6B5Y0_9AGAM|nr:hypothetical protein BS47DRAFT_417918 [Hydnum rufescens UP504]
MGPAGHIDSLVRIQGRCSSFPPAFPWRGKVERLGMMGHALWVTLTVQRIVCHSARAGANPSRHRRSQQEVHCSGLHRISRRLEAHQECAGPHEVDSFWVVTHVANRPCSLAQDFATTRTTGNTVERSWQKYSPAPQAFERTPSSGARSSVVDG